MLAELGNRDALSIADASGPFIVGLTVLPPRPGPAEIRVQVLGVDAGDGLRNARFSAATGGASVEVPLAQACALGCFAGSTTFANAGDWQLKVEIDSNRSPISMSTSVPLPAPDGAGALARTLAAEESLKSAVMTERLTSSVDGLAYVSTYRFQAPDRAEITLNDSTQVLTGEERFSREGDGPREKAAFPPPGFSWPSGYYSDFWEGAVAARIVGTDTVDGVPTQVITFVRPDVPAWFRVWVRQSDGIIQREEMRAEGHIMDHSFAELNGPIRVEPPP